MPSISLASRANLTARVATTVAIATLAGGAHEDIGGYTSDAQVVVTAHEAAERGAPTADASESGRIEEWTRAPACDAGFYRNDLAPGCSDDAHAITVTCADGSDALDPWWMRYRTPSGEWSRWRIIGWYQCPADLFATALENTWDSMSITPNTVSIQPDTGWVLTTVPTIVYVDRAPRTRNVTLLGTPVIIRATASAYTWRWGDGTRTVTARPGARYPNQTVTHTYLHLEGHVTIRLTTSWRGSYSTDGGATWRSAPGTAYTTSTPITVRVYNPHTHRVDCDLDGHCVSGADGPAGE